MISFNEVPANIRVPFSYVEFDSSKAVQSGSLQPYNSLIVGQKLSTGTAAALAVQSVSSFEQAKELFGAGSMLALMAKAYFLNNKTIPLDIIAFDDVGAGVKAAGSFLLSGPATKSGTLSIYINGTKVEVSVTAGNTSAVVVSALNNAINNNADLPVVSAIDGGNTSLLTITAKHKGLYGNSISLDYNYLSSEITPAGLGITITAMSGGTTAPDFDDLWTELGDKHYNGIGSPYTDSTSLASVKTELLDRAGATRQIEAFCITSARGTLGDLQTLGQAHNNQYLVIADDEKCLNHPSEKAAAMLGQIMDSASKDPARPFQTLVLVGIKPARDKDQRLLLERNTLLFNGIATTTVNASNEVIIETVVTTRKENDFGGDDTAWLYLNIPLTLGYLRYDLRRYFASKYSRHKLADDGNKFGKGQKVMTPKLAKAEFVGLCRTWNELGLVENIDQFKNDLVAERDPQNPSRLNIELGPDLVNQMRVLGVKISYLI
jgi:phage tail sheath gpL-like